MLSWLRKRVGNLHRLSTPSTIQAEPDLLAGSQRLLSHHSSQYQPIGSRYNDVAVLPQAVSPQIDS